MIHPLDRDCRWWSKVPKTIISSFYHSWRPARFLLLQALQLHVAPPAAVAEKHEEEDEGSEKQTSTRRIGNERASCGKSFESHSIASPPQSSPQHLVDIMVSLWFFLDFFSPLSLAITLFWFRFHSFSSSFWYHMITTLSCASFFAVLCFLFVFKVVDLAISSGYISASSLDLVINCLLKNGSSDVLFSFSAFFWFLRSVESISLFPADDEMTCGFGFGVVLGFFFFSGSDFCVWTPVFVLEQDRSGLSIHVFLHCSHSHLEIVPDTWTLFIPKALVYVYACISFVDSQGFCVPSLLETILLEYLWLWSFAPLIATESSDIAVRH